MNLPRKKPQRLFTGLVGLPPEPEEGPKPEIVPVPVTATPPNPQTLAALEQEILTAKKKRGRPRIHVDNAAKQRVHRKTKKERDEQAAAEQEMRYKIDKIMRENRDTKGRIHDESSGGDGLFVAERVNTNSDSSYAGTYEWVDIEGQKHTSGGGKRRIPGTDGIAFEKGIAGRRKKEKQATWANGQNFFQAAHWDEAQAEEFIEWMAGLVMTFEDLENGEFILRCQMCPYVRMIDKAYREELNNTGHTYHDLPVYHLCYDHKKFVTEAVKEHGPHPPELQKKPEKCSEADHRRFAEVFADRLPFKCRHCKTEISGKSQELRNEGIR